jgi:hypothetical protein
MAYLLACIAVGTLAVGFLAGLLSFKVKLRWCRECGATLRCVDCLARKRSAAPLSASTRSRP